MEVARQQRLIAEDWTTAALQAIGDGGLAAVAVESLAAKMGTTKGSFYWHFTNRDALVGSALERWERTETEDVITEVEKLPAGTPRLRWLISGAMRDRHTASMGARVELALQPTAAHPLVAPVLERVTRRRLDYLSVQFAELGFGPDDAARRGLLAYTVYLGHSQLAHATPDAGPPDPAAHVETVISVLTT